MSISACNYGRHIYRTNCVTCELFVNGAEGTWDSFLAFLVEMDTGCCSLLGADAGSAFAETWVASKKCISSQTPMDEWYLQAMCRLTNIWGHADGPAATSYVTVEPRTRCSPDASCHNPAAPRLLTQEHSQAAEVFPPFPRLSKKHTQQQD